MARASFEGVGKVFAGSSSRRRLLGGLGAGGLAAVASAAGVARGGWAQEGTPEAPRGTVPPGLPPFVYRLEQSEPQRFAGGTIRTATVDDIPPLKGMAVFTEVIDPGAIRELHWHPNAHELAYVLAGEGVLGVLKPNGETIAFPVSAGSVGFAPAGYPHYIVNDGADPLRLVIAFSHEKPEFLDFSIALPPVPTSLVAESFGVSAAEVPLLPRRGDVTIVPLAGAIPRPEMSEAAASVTLNVNDLEPNVYIGGTTRPVVADTLPSLQGLSLFPLTAEPFGLREPHWHTNASELNYCVSGQAQIGIVAPSGATQTFVVGPGDVCYVPVNWFHYIANIADEPLEFLVFFSDPRPTHVDLSQLPAAFPVEVLAASFGVDPEVFSRLPRRGDVFLASDEVDDGATPAP